jgi:DHA2 family multidrug resistance protein
MSDRQPEFQGFTGGHNPWAVALTVTMATFMEVLDTSIANVSLPHMAGNLSVSQDQATWVLTSYLVSNAVVLPVSGWFATRFGRKRFYMTCVAIFTLSSFLCGIAPSLGWLVLFRVIQGVGGGGLAPTEQAILADTFAPSRRGMAFAVYGMAVVLAPAIGPTLGGFITDHFTWRWVFFINVPVGIASLLLSSRIVVDPPWLGEARRRMRRIDFGGFGLIALGLGSLEVVLDRGQELDWFSDPNITAFALVAVVALVVFVFWELRQEEPVVDVRLFKNRGFALSTLMMLSLGFALYGTTVLLPQYVQVWMGYSAQQAGEVLSPGGVVIILLMPFVGRLVGKVDVRWLIAFGFTVLALSLLHMAHALYPGIDLRTAILLRVYQAVSLAFLFVPINTVAYQGIPPERNNAVAGIINLARNMGGDIGIATMTTLLARRTQFHQARLVEGLDAGNAGLQARLAQLAAGIAHAGTSSADAARRAYAALGRQLAQQAQTLAYIDVLFVFACITAIMVPLVFLTRRARPGAAAMAH